MTSDPDQGSGPPSTPLGFKAHDHAACVAQALRAAEERCAAEGLRLTPVRRAVLEFLLKEHRALGAYAILDMLDGAGFGSQPPVAYRALDFLVGHGFAHRIESMNAFVACTHPGEAHSPAFMICQRCDAVAEACGPMAGAALDDAARAVGFEIKQAVIEVEGICSGCADGATP